LRRRIPITGMPRQIISSRRSGFPAPAMRPVLGRKATAMWQGDVQHARNLSPKSGVTLPHSGLDFGGLFAVDAERFLGALTLKVQLMPTFNALRLAFWPPTLILVFPPTRSLPFAPLPFQLTRRPPRLTWVILPLCV
jgi:hypothetical protein